MHRYNFDRDILKSVAGGTSALDIPRLNIHTQESAESFIKCYGFDLKRPDDVMKLWYYHRRAIVLMVEKLGFTENEIPEMVRDQKNLKDISFLLLMASSRNPAEKNLQRWSCALLRCMHVFVHNENDLFHSFSQEIQNQILSPFQQSIVHDGNNHKIFLRAPGSMKGNPVELSGFEIKPFKTSSSTVIKLLARPEALAMKIFDKLGVRFITPSLFDSFQVLRFLVEEDLMSFPHIMPDQSSNNLYPVELFLEICEELTNKGQVLKDEELQRIFDQRLGASSAEGMFRKPNEHSASDFKFIKFIARKLIQIQPPGGERFSFFYPYEVQIVDQVSHQKALSGPSEHEAYKERQKQAARERLFPGESL